MGAMKTACDANKWSARGEGICKFFLAGIAGLQAGINYDGVYDVIPASATGTGAANFEDCDAKMGTGYYSLYGTIDCKPCPVGHYCPSSDKAPKVCEPGKYQD